jgi:hypothetical protein
MSDVSLPVAPFEKNFADVLAFGAAFTRLVNLSKYLDAVMQSTLTGNVSLDSTKPMLERAMTIYNAVLDDVTGALAPDAAAMIEEARVQLKWDVADPLLGAFVVDQMHAVVHSLLSSEGFLAGLRMQSLQQQQQEREAARAHAAIVGDKAGGVSSTYL